MLFKRAREQAQNRREEPENATLQERREIERKLKQLRIRSRNTRNEAVWDQIKRLEDRLQQLDELQYSWSFCAGPGHASGREENAG